MRRRILGLLLIVAGLLFALVPLSLLEYETWAGQRELEAFLAQMQRQDPAEQAAERAAASSYNDNLDQTGEATEDPFDADPQFGAPDLAPRPDAYGYMVIPAIDVNLPIYLGASKEHLGYGLGQVEGTSLPVGGVGTRSVIAGHRGGYTNHFFLFVDRLKPGDRIHVVVQGELLTYEVYGDEVIDPSEWEKLAAVEGQDTLTLLTCTPPPVNSHRLLVDARRVLPPAGQQVDAAQQLRQEVAASPVDGGRAAWQWATRAAIVVLAAALVWVVVALVRDVRG